MTAAISDPKDNKKASDLSVSNMRLADVLPRLLQPASGAGAAATDPQRAAHWAYHLVRHLGFNGLAFAGFAAHDLVERLQRLQRQVAGGGRGSSSGGTSRTPFKKLLEGAEAELAYRLSDFIEAVDQDYDNIRSSYYPLPWDMTSSRHRQYNPAYVAASSAAYVGEWVKITQRRLAKQPETVWLDGGKLYPQYYNKTFHFQTDGWFSARSAFVYETTTEALFSGLQDIMQRTSLLPIADYVREAESGSGPASSASGASERSPAQLRLLEVAAGTGRFHTFIKDAYPDMRTVCSDLSPFTLPARATTCATGGACVRPGASWAEWTRPARSSCRLPRRTSPRPTKASTSLCACTCSTSFPRRCGAAPCPSSRACCGRAVCWCSQTACSWGTGRRGTTPSACSATSTSPTTGATWPATWAPCARRRA